MSYKMAYQSLWYISIYSIHRHMISTICCPAKYQLTEIACSYNHTVIFVCKVHKYLCAFSCLTILEDNVVVVFGVADIIGAFAAGLIISGTPRAGYIESRFSPLSYLLLTPIFFANIGLTVTLPQMTPRLALFTLLLIIAAVLSKLAGCGLGAKLCGFTGRQSLQTGLGMVCRGEVALIVANKGMAAGMIAPLYFGPIILMVVACTIATPVLLKLAYRDARTAQLLEASRLVDRYEMAGELDAIAAQLVKKESRHRRHALDVFSRTTPPKH